MRTLLLLVLTLGTLSASATQPRSLVLLFTGDNGGEIAPCG